jgi:hypothetical protein
LRVHHPVNKYGEESRTIPPEGLPGHVPEKILVLNFFLIIHNGLCVFVTNQGAHSRFEMYTFFVIATLMGGRAPDREP